jgi:DNA-binding response OmpR family regulator
MKRIVVIDDSALVLKAARKALEGAGYDVTTFEEPGDFDPDRTGRPDLILVDVNMPQFFGDDVVSYIKDTWMLEAPVLLFSNVPERELADAARRCGADGYISKHKGLDELVATVRALLEKSTAVAR